MYIGQGVWLRNPIAGGVLQWWRSNFEVGFSNLRFTLKSANEREFGCLTQWNLLGKCTGTAPSLELLVWYTVAMLTCRCMRCDLWVSRVVSYLRRSTVSFDWNAIHCNHSIDVSTVPMQIHDFFIQQFEFLSINRHWAQVPAKTRPIIFVIVRCAFIFRFISTEIWFE